jgi:hypothetical protein
MLHVRFLFWALHLSWDKKKGLTIRPEPVEGWAVKPIIVRLFDKLTAHHERLNLKLSRVKLKALFSFGVDNNSFNGHGTEINVGPASYSVTP